MNCTACQGVFYPATGCQYSARVVVCGPCVRQFWAWFRGHQNRGRGPNFYVAATKFVTQTV